MTGNQLRNIVIVPATGRYAALRIPGRRYEDGNVFIDGDAKSLWYLVEGPLYDQLMALAEPRETWALLPGRDIFSDIDDRWRASQLVYRYTPEEDAPQRTLEGRKTVWYCPTYFVTGKYRPCEVELKFED